MRSSVWHVVLVPMFFFLAALAVNLLLLRGQACIEEDGVAYAAAGVRFFQGLGFSGIYPPGYPVLIGLANMFVSDVELAARLVSVFFSALSMFPLYYLARWSFGGWVASVACGLALLYPALAEYSSAALSESSFLFFFLCGVFVSGAACKTGKYLLCLLAGLLWGMAFLVRPEGFGYLVLGVVVLAGLWARSRQARWLLCLACYIAGFSIMSFPYALNQKQQTGRWSLGNKAGMNFVLGEAVGGGEDWGVSFEKCYYSLSGDGRKLSYEVMLESGPGTVGYVLSHKKELVRRYLVNLHLVNKYVIPGLFGPLVIVLFAAGLLLGNGGDTKRAAVLFLAFVPYLAFPLFIVAPRYFVYFVPIVLIWVARGVVELAKLMTGVPRSDAAAVSRWQLGAEAIILAVVVASFVPFTFNRLIKGGGNSNVYREIGAWMKANVSPQSRVMARKPWVSFYAGLEQVGLPYEPWEKVLNYARFKGAGFLVADQKIIGHWPALKPLFDGPIQPKGVEMIREFKAADGNRVKVYRFVDQG